MMADIGGGEPQQPGNEQGKGEEGEGAVGLLYDGLVFAMLEKFSGSLLWWEGYLKILFHLLNNFHRAVVVAVVAVLVVQTAVYDVVDVIAVRYGFVAAAFAVNMTGTSLHGVAAVGVGGVYIEAVLVVVAVVLVVQVAVMDVVDVVTVFDRGLAAAFAVNVLVVGMGMAVAHFVSFHKGVFIDGVMIAEIDVGCK